MLHSRLNNLCMLHRNSEQIYHSTCTRKVMWVMFTLGQLLRAWLNWKRCVILFWILFKIKILLWPKRCYRNNHHEDARLNESFRNNINFDGFSNTKSLFKKISLQIPSSRKFRKQLQWVFIRFISCSVKRYAVFWLVRNFRTFFLNSSHLVNPICHYLIPVSIATLRTMLTRETF